MTERRTSLSAGLAGLAVAWIVAYWWWDPTPSVRFDEQATVQMRFVATQPDIAPPPTGQAIPVERSAAASPGQTATGRRESGPLPAPIAAVRADEPTPVEPKTRTPRSATQSYVVEHGDTLSEIAQRAYGSARYASLLFEHNRERLDLASPDAIQPGQTLELPSVETDAGEGTGDE